MKRTPIEIYNLRASQPDFCCLEDLPQEFINAIISAEDDKFYEHKGISYYAIKCAIADFLKGEPLVGGSTITQQLVKNLYFHFERSFIRKLKEAVLAKKFERKLTKKQILELYLNVIYFDNGQYGIYNASRFYFGKPPIDMTPNQSFILGYLLPVVGAFNPLYHPKEYLEFRREKILFSIKKGTLPEGFLSKIENFTDDRLDAEMCSATKETDKYDNPGPLINERFGPGMPDSLTGK